MQKSNAWPPRSPARPGRPRRRQSVSLSTNADDDCRLTSAWTTVARALCGSWKGKPGPLCHPGSENGRSRPWKRPRFSVSGRRVCERPSCNRWLVILDSSAVVPLLLGHAGYEDIFEALAGADALGMGAPTLWETGIVLAARLSIDPTGLLGRFVQEYGVQVIPFAEPHWWEAMDAFWRFGKGHHRAGLNFGDCLTYA